MKVVYKKISVICWFDEYGKIKPIKFRIIEENLEEYIFKIDKIIQTTEEKFIGIDTLCFLCETTKAEKIYLFELKYEIKNHLWILYKIQ
ncbi:MAG: hypothetical protein ACK5LV_05635 [Lachnospirales bacterium]